MYGDVARKYANKDANKALWVFAWKLFAIRFLLVGLLGLVKIQLKRLDC